MSGTKKPSRKTLVRKLDKMWSQIIRSGGRCELCGSVGKLDAHHIEGRSPMGLRWDLDNGIALCFRCHRLGVHSPASSVQAEFREKITALRGKETMMELKKRRYIINKISTPDLREKLKEYEDKIQNILI